MYSEFNKYYSIIADLNKKADLLWTQVNFITIGDIVDRQIDLKQLDKLCWQIRDVESTNYREANQKIQKYSDEEYEGKLEEIDNELNDGFTQISNKTDIIDSVITKLIAIQEILEDDRYINLFSDSTNFDLNENLIQIKRFYK